MTKHSSIRVDAEQYKLYRGHDLIPLNGKKPIERDWTTRPRYDSVKMTGRCINENRNMGFRCRNVDLVIDVDKRAGGLKSLEDLQLDVGLILKNYPCVLTGSGGLHIYCSKPTELKIPERLDAYPGVEFKSRGRQVVCAGSIHPDTGRRYQFVKGHPRLGKTSPPAPSALLEMLARPERPPTIDSGGEFTVEQIEQALAKLEVSNFSNHDKWLQLMMAVHHASGGAAREEFIAWSIADPEFADQAEEIGKRWDSLDPHRADAVTFRTLNKILIEHGAGNLTQSGDVSGDFEGNQLDSFERQRIVKLNNIKTVIQIQDNFRFVNLNGKMRVAYWGKSPLDPKVRQLQFWSVPEFQSALRNRTVDIDVPTTDKNGKKSSKTITVSLANKWLNDPARYTYDGVILALEDNSATPDAINLWRGFGVEPTPGDWSLMRNHIFYVIAKGKKERFDYIIKWFAWAIQNPEKPGEVALILKSVGHGTGKGMVLRALRKLFGAHGMQISKAGLLTGRFNAHLATTCFLFVDEMTLGDNKETATLNSTLTEDVIAIEPKGIDAFMMPNHVKVAAASNQEHVVFVADTDRRYAVFEVSDAHAKDIPYFKAIDDQLKAGGYGAMLYDLSNMELSDWHPRQTVPDDKDREKVASAAPELQWFAGLLESGVLPCQVDGKGGHVAMARDLYNDARRSVRALQAWSDYRFSQFLKQRGAVSRHTRYGNVWEFPALADLREMWQQEYHWWPAFDENQEIWGDDSGKEFDESGVDADTNDS